MKRWYRIVVSLLGAVIALYVAGIYDPFSQMKLIPQGKSYDVCITVYFALFDAIVNWIVDSVCELVERRKTVISVKLQSDSYDAAGVPQISLSDEIAEFKLKVHISGLRKNIAGKQILFKALKQASYTIGSRRTGIHLENNGDISIRLDEVMSDTDNASDIVQEYVIDLQLNDNEDMGTIWIEPEEMHNNRFVRFEHNHAALSFGRDK